MLPELRPLASPIDAFSKNDFDFAPYTFVHLWHHVNTYMAELGEGRRVFHTSSTLARLLRCALGYGDCERTGHKQS
jgi:hypothetical protein